MAGVWCHNDVLMSGTRCQLLWASVMSHVQGTVRPQSPGQRQPTAPMQWSQATAQISTSSRMRPARPPISRGSLLKPPDWLSQTIASSVDTQQHQVYCTILHHNCKFLLRETISSLDLKLDRDLYFKDAKGLLFMDWLGTSWWFSEWNSDIPEDIECEHHDE